MGRDTKYDPSFCDRAISLMRDGASKTQVMADLGVGREAFYNYTKDHEDFKEAVELGKLLSQAWWEAAGQKGIYMGKDFNSVAWIYNMKNRFRDEWSDKTETEISGKNGAPIRIDSNSSMSDEELEKRIYELNTKTGKGGIVTPPGREAP